MRRPACQQCGGGLPQSGIGTAGEFGNGGYRERGIDGQQTFQARELNGRARIGERVGEHLGRRSQRWESRERPQRLKAQRWLVRIGGEIDQQRRGIWPTRRRRQPR